MEPQINYRLPDNFYPLRYEITVRPYFTVTTMPQTFDGYVKILFRCQTNTNKLVLHSIGLILDNSTLGMSASSLDSDNVPISNVPWKYDHVTSFLTFELPDGYMFRAGRSYTFYGSYQGRLQANNLGLFRTSYNDGFGTQKYIKSL